MPFAGKGTPQTGVAAASPAEGATVQQSGKVDVMVTRIGPSLFLALVVFAATPAFAIKTPEIRISASNQVPACVTPARLMAFVKKRNKRLDPRFRDIATYYQLHGEAIGVRWDYAFFQMIVETNWLKYRTGSGKPSDVSPSQYNFAGLGATGGGEPGERFTDVSSGVLAHLQHIKMYSGELVDNPVANRTRKVQTWLVSKMQRLGRPVTFTDLTREWSPSDRGYAADIEYVARAYRKLYCTGKQQPRRRPQADTRLQTASMGPVPRPQGTCKVWTASYDGAQKSLLIMSVARGAVHYTALDVHEGKEEAEARAFIEKYAKGGKMIGTYKSRKEALANAFRLCPEQS